ncbi:MAG TPA: hypothetical protein VN762_14790 [Steroidobacteraceae bacterium]|nr:hypothetical protein [Steroidobacteraceae bacterium]
MRAAGVLGLWILASALSVAHAAAPSPPDLSGVWLPVEQLATPWPAALPLTEAAKQRYAKFHPDRDEPAGFCMPLGTPRNTLAGTGPMEVLQTSDRVYFIFQPNLLNAETRRVYLDGRSRAAEEDRIPTWLGSSRGRWEGRTLVMETTDLEPQAILNAQGLSHSGALVVRERWQLARDARRGEVLVDELTLVDAESFATPINLRRVFVRAPDARLDEGQCSEGLWIERLWRHRLAEHAAARQAPATTGAEKPAGAAGARP